MALLIATTQKNLAALRKKNGTSATHQQRRDYCSTAKSMGKLLPILAVSASLWRIILLSTKLHTSVQRTPSQYQAETRV